MILPCTEETASSALAIERSSASDALQRDGLKAPGFMIWIFHVHTCKA